MTARGARVVSDEPLMSMAEVADRLGVPLKTFRHWRAHHRAPQGYRLGREVRFRWSEVDAWLQQQREPMAPARAAVTSIRRPRSA